MRLQNLSSVGCNMGCCEAMSAQILVLGQTRKGSWASVGPKVYVSTSLILEDIFWALRFPIGPNDSFKAGRIDFVIRAAGCGDHDGSSSQGLFTEVFEFISVLTKGCSKAEVNNVHFLIDSPGQG